MIEIQRASRHLASKRRCSLSAQGAARRNGPSKILLLPPDEIAQCVGQRQNFGRHAAFGTTNGLALRPPFAPCPWRWTLTMVASTMAYSMSGGIRAGFEKLGENVRFDPVAVPLENSVPVAEHRRKVTPRGSRPHDPKHRFDKAAVVASAAPGVRRLTQTMRLHLRPLGVCLYESFHPKLESQPCLGWNPDSQQALGRLAPGRFVLFLVVAKCLDQAAEHLGRCFKHGLELRFSTLWMSSRRWVTISCRRVFIFWV